VKQFSKIFPPPAFRRHLADPAYMVINENHSGLIMGVPVLNQDIPRMKIAVAAPCAMKPCDLNPNLPEDLYPVRMPFVPLPEPLRDALGIFQFFHYQASTQENFP
jgi:hypothetical protein